MLSLFRLKETSRRLRDGDWSAKNDLFCLGFFLFVQWLSVTQGNKWASGDYVILFKIMELWAIRECWKANGAVRGVDFLRRLLALYRCCTLRLWSVVLFSVVLTMLAGFIGCIFLGDSSGALYGECAYRIFSEKIPSFIGSRVFPSAIGWISDFFTVGYFFAYGIFAFFWGTIDYAFVKLATKKPLLALSDGSDPLSDLSE